MRKLGRGRTIFSRQGMEDYRKEPFLSPYLGTGYCWLPNIWSTVPEEPDTADPLPSGQPHILTKGKIVNS